MHRAHCHRCRRHHRCCCCLSTTVRDCDVNERTRTQPTAHWKIIESVCVIIFTVLNSFYSWCMNWWIDKGSRGTNNSNNNNQLRKKNMVREWEASVALRNFLMLAIRDRVNHDCFFFNVFFLFSCCSVLPFPTCTHVLWCVVGSLLFPFISDRFVMVFLALLKHTLTKYTHWWLLHSFFLSFYADNRRAMCLPLVEMQPVAKFSALQRCVLKDDANTRSPSPNGGCAMKWQTAAAERVAQTTTGKEKLHTHAHTSGGWRFTHKVQAM